MFLPWRTCGNTTNHFNQSVVSGEGSFFFFLLLLLLFFNIPLIGFTFLGISQYRWTANFPKMPVTEVWSSLDLRMLSIIGLVISKSRKLRQPWKMFIENFRFLNYTWQGLAQGVNFPAERDQRGLQLDWSSLSEPEYHSNRTCFNCRD